MRDYAEQHDEVLRRSEAKAEAPSHADATAGRGPLNAQRVLSLQRSVGNAGTASMLESREEQASGASPIHDTIAGSGQSLDEGTRGSMERYFGQDFSDVRLHVDAKSAESVHAAAYTVGNNIVVHPNHFQAGTPSAQRTLAHELTHVVQQRSGPVAGSEAPGGIKLSDPGDRFEQEAEAKASSFMSHPADAASPGRLGAAGDQQADVQRLAVQREEESEAESEEG